jgi:hypothetical protein
VRTPNADVILTTTAYIILLSVLVLGGFTVKMLEKFDIRTGVTEEDMVRISAAIFSLFASFF